MRGSYSACSTCSIRCWLRDAINTATRLPPSRRRGYEIRSSSSAGQHESVAITRKTAHSPPQVAIVRKQTKADPSNIEAMRQSAAPKRGESWTSPPTPFECSHAVIRPDWAASSSVDDGGTTSPASSIEHRNAAAGNTDWFRIRNTADTAELLFYENVGSAEPFARELAAIDTMQLIVRINSRGGSAFDGIAIYNAIARHPAHTTVYVDGLAASAASVIAMAGDEIVISKYAKMMIHDASGVVMGTAADMTAFAKVLDQLSANIATVYADRAGGDVKNWRAAMHAETWYPADAAVKAGLADRIDTGRTTPQNVQRAVAVAAARRQRTRLIGV